MTILLVTNREDYTADFVVLELQRRNLSYVRLNTEDIPSLVAINWSLGDQNENYIEYKQKKIALNEITSIWYRRPVAPVPSPEITDDVARDFVISESRSTFAGIWRSLDCFWVSHPDNLHAASFKIVQLQLAKKLGFNIPRTLVTTIPKEAKNFVSQMEGSVVYKPISATKIRRERHEGFIFTNIVTSDHINQLDHVQYAPAQFQTLVKKKADIRVTVIGRKVFAVAIDSQSLSEAVIDWRKGDVSRMKHTVIELPTEIESRCLMLTSKLGLNFGTIDLILDPEDEYCFLEINPNGQWAWIEQFTELPLTATLVDLLAQKDK